MQDVVAILPCVLGHELFSWETHSNVVTRSDTRELIFRMLVSLGGREPQVNLHVAGIFTSTPTAQGVGLSHDLSPGHINCRSGAGCQHRGLLSRTPTASACVELSVATWAADDRVQASGITLIRRHCVP